MNLIFRLLWGRRWIVITSVVACLLGGLTVMYVSAPRYSGSARVTLDYVRPDPTTGTVVPSKMLEAYLNSQLRLLRDNQVAIPAAESLGWLDNPELQAAYANRPDSDRRDFESWVASRIINGTYAHMVEDSNIMEITYNAPSKELATAVAEALRTAYIQSSVESARTAARLNGDRTARQIEKTKIEIAALQDRLQELERENNVMITKTGIDEESAKLRSLAEAAPDRILSRRSTANTAAVLQLRALDEDIARRSSQLGPNNPLMLQMQQQRRALAAQVVAEGDTAESRTRDLEAANRASSARLEDQKSKVLSLRGPILQMKLVQDELREKSDVLESQTKDYVQLRQDATKSTGSIAPIGVATPSDKPVFPNPWLIIPASIVLGLLAGSLTAFLVEFLDRRIRCVRDLETATQTPVLAAVPNLTRRRTRRKDPRRRPTVGITEPAL